MAGDTGTHWQATTSMIFYMIKFKFKLTLALAPAPGRFKLLLTVLNVP